MRVLIENLDNSNPAAPSQLSLCLTLDVVFVGIDHMALRDLERRKERTNGQQTRYRVDRY